MEECACINKLLVQFAFQFISVQKYERQNLQVKLLCQLLFESGIPIDV